MTPIDLERECDKAARAIRNSPQFYPAGTEPEASQLLNLIAAMMPNCRHMLEIGVDKGFTTCHLIKASARNGSKVWAIDICDRRHQALLNLWKWHRFIRGDSVDVLREWNPANRIGFVFVDGRHEADHVGMELDLLLPLLDERESVVAVHDTLLFPKIHAFVEDWSSANGFERITIHTANVKEKRCDSTGLTVCHRSRPKNLVD